VYVRRSGLLWKAGYHRAQLGPVHVGVGIACILEIVVWRQTNSNSVGTNGGSDCFDDFQYETRSLLDASAVFVGAGIDVVVEELIEEVTICAYSISHYAYMQASK
jgi:hypothetical protein